MARKPNKNPSKPVKFRATPGIRAYLEDIRATDLYGATESEVAQRLVTQGIALLIQQGVIKRRGSESETG